METMTAETTPMKEAANTVIDCMPCDLPSITDKVVNRTVTCAFVHVQCSLKVVAGFGVYFQD